MATHSGVRLLDAVYCDPGDDASRRVYGDWLLEQEDPRGELIALQLGAVAGSDQRSAATAKRAAALVKQHGRTWLGPLAPVLLVKGVEFRRGFLASAIARFRVRADFEALVHDPSWATVERLAYSVPTLFSDGQEVWRYGMSAAMRGLQVVDGHAAALLDADATWPRLHTAKLRFGDHSRMRGLLGSQQLPALEELEVDDFRVEPAWFASVKTVPFRVLRVRGNVARLPEWLAVAREVGIATLRFDHRVARTSATWRLDVEAAALTVDNETVADGDLVAALAALPASSLSSFTLTGRSSPEIVAAGESRVARSVKRAPLSSSVRRAAPASTAREVLALPQSLVVTAAGWWVAEPTRLVLLDPDTGAALHHLVTNRSAARTFAAGGTHALLVTEAWSERITLATGVTERFALRVNARSASLSADGRVAAGANENYFQALDLAAGGKPIEKHASSGHIALRPDGGAIAFASSNPASVHVLALVPRARATKLGADSNLTGLCWLPDGTLITAHGSGGVHRWDPAAQAAAPLPAFDAGPRPSNLVASPTGRHLAFTPTAHAPVRVVDLATGAARDLAPALAYAFTPDGAALVLASTHAAAIALA